MNFDDLTWRPPPPLLDAKLQRGLVAAGYTEIHQSGLNMGRECPQKLHLSTRHREQRSMGLHALFGSVFHAGIELNESVENMCSMEFWLAVIQQVASRDVYRVEQAQLIDYAQDLTVGRSIGKSMCELIMETMAELARCGIMINSIEERLVLKSGKVSFVGTLDMRASMNGEPMIIDVKTSGLWGPVIDQSAIKKQSYSAEELFCHTQLRHYDWMSYRMGLGKSSVYALLTPANLIPYAKNGAGYNKGDKRGSLLHLVPAATDEAIRSYELDVINFLKGYVNGPYRAYPTNFGKPLCPGCPYYNVCMKDTTSNLQANALEDSQYDYLKEM
jgi:hypothetical protein